MLGAWLEQNTISHAVIIDPNTPPTDISNHENVTYLSRYDDKKIESDVLILAVKPQILKGATAQIAKNLSQKTVLLSIAAGQTLEALENIFGADQAIVRTMPNTPALVQKGASVSIANTATHNDQKSNVTALLQANGSCRWIEDETLMDAVTALSGSGPAYIFYLIEALAKTGEKLGLPTDMATALARETVIGSASLAEHEHKTSASTLRENVTSPGGTTQAALEILMDGKFQECLDKALGAAKQRSIDLNN